MINSRNISHIRPVTSASLLALTSLLASVHPAAAQVDALNFTSGSATENNAAAVPAPSYSLGFQFTANDSIFVTALGFFNDPSFSAAANYRSLSLSAPLTGTYSYADDHQVGLYQVVPGVGGGAQSGLLLGSVTVTKSSTASGDFLYTSLLAPIALVSSDQYVLTGVTGATDPYLYNYADANGNPVLPVNPAITFNQNLYDVSSSLAFPTQTDSTLDPGFFGPNFQFSAPAAVPEFSSDISLALLMALGLGTLALRARRRSAAAR